MAHAHKRLAALLTLYFLGTKFDTDIFVVPNAINDASSTDR